MTVTLHDGDERHRYTREEALLELALIATRPHEHTKIVATVQWEDGAGEERGVVITGKAPDVSAAIANLKVGA